ncbi:MAG TPA: spore germination protein [Clostridiales bacterium]|nr:spore germination protein [Clostridiales bacterium]
MRKGNDMSFLNIIKRNLLYQCGEEKEKFVLKKNEYKPIYDVREEKSPQRNQTIFTEIEKNKNFIKKKFNYPKNVDVIIRELILKGDTKCFLVFYDGMCDSDAINNGIIKPMLEIPFFDKRGRKYDKKTILESLIVHNQVKEENFFDELIDGINFGGCGIFVDGINAAFCADVKNWPHRSVEKAKNEQSIYGPQEAFIEMLRGNSAQIRKFLKTEKLICEAVSIGNVSKTPGVIMYLGDVANKALVEEVKRRISGISSDYVISIEEVSMMIEENPLMITGHILATERPDRVARAISEGRVALVLSGSPRVLILPTNAYEMTHSASDAYLRVDFANMSRMIRLIATAISVLLPGLFLAITMYHAEMLPTYLLYAISASRQNVPFPSVVELLLMDFSFEMIREAGIRMPNPIGSVLGIVGGLILGQAAVSAKIVSPIMIIIISLTGIGSFATADYALSWTYRILKMIFILIGASFGFFGIALGIFVYAILIASSTSFGIPFLSPAPGNKLLKNAVLVPPAWKMERRPEYLKTKKPKRGDKISKKWQVGT